MIPRKPWSDYDSEQIIGRLLRNGVILSAVVAIMGAVFFMVMHGSEEPHYRIFVGEPTDLKSVHGVLSDLFKGKSRAIIQFGILLLIATPVARVAFSVYAFMRERDRVYVCVTLLVLALLLLSLSGTGLTG